ncbi:MAG: adenylate/guanylate cyclase, partial [Cyclobacteriaceae bacterium]|nr:adenylate/guanylate cyclase [Cyclobacteriaceae bacterium]
LKLKNEKIMEQQKQIIEEKRRSDTLLHNILPAPVATELKQNGKARPMLYDMVSVLFTDFKGFTTIASSMNPDEIVDELEICFSAFDNIIEKHNLEKIKTMGDGYMAAGGIPIRNSTNAIDAVLAGMEMQRFMRWKQEEKRKMGQKYFELRVGIHTGPVVAGVIGKKKFAYDIWGDAVNLASRMESSGVEGKVNISYATYQQIQDHFFVTYRGRVDAKNKGFVDMYFVEGLREKNGKHLIK